ncbi:MAG TPA: hypothetical protein VKA38_08475 [Draconibacterium sp.]|nr:hypothetical protein [Draconibacterium sp.]
MSDIKCSGGYVKVANKGTIISFGGGIVFATDLGLYLLVGPELTVLTEEVKGLPNTDFQVNTNYQLYLDDVRLVNDMVNKLSDVDILDDLVNSKLGFDKENRELLVTNSSKNYSYVYSFKTGFWHPVDESFSILINFYPKLYVLRASGDDAGIIFISDEEHAKKP